MDSLTELFCLIDDFCRRFEPAWERRRLTTGPRRRRRGATLSLSELMTGVVLFHPWRFRPFKGFYLDYACHHRRAAFPKAQLPSRRGAVAPVRRAPRGDHKPTLQLMRVNALAAS